MPLAIKLFTIMFGSWDSYKGPVKHLPFPGKETEAECRKRLPWVTSGSRFPFQLHPMSSPAGALLLFPPEQQQYSHHGSKPSAGKGTAIGMTRMVAVPLKAQQCSQPCRTQHQGSGLEEKPPC